MDDVSRFVSVLRAKPYFFSFCVFLVLFGAFHVVHTQNQRLDALRSLALRAQQGASVAMAHAIDQTMACLSRHDQEAEDQRERQEWVPCLPQGEGVLRDAGAEVEQFDLVQRLGPLHQAVLRN